MKNNSAHHGSHLGRYREIALVLIKYRLDELVQTLGLTSFLPFHLVPPEFPWRKQDLNSKPERTRLAIEELGTTFVKVGQILSTRTDILPSDYIQALAKLQDSLKPIPVEAVKQAIYRELKKSPEEIFTEFDPKPLGVASIGQAHAARLTDGTNVVIKVQKPGVIQQVAEDLDILHHLAVSATERHETLGYYDLLDLVEEITDTMTAELDYMREGHSAEYFARFFKDDPTVHIPKVYWQYTTSGVITMERIQGIPIHNLDDLDKAGFNRKDLSVRTVNLWVKMVFEDTVFHADPHPGNLFVEPDGRLGLVDFGMIGLIDIDVRNSLSDAVKAILENDTDFLVDSLLNMGAVTSLASRENLRKDLKHVMMHLPLTAHEFHSASNLSDLFAVVRRNKIKLPANTFLLMKTMAMAQSLGTSLDKDFDFFHLLAPHVDAEVRRRYKPSTILRRLPRSVGDLAIFGVGLPSRIVRIVSAIERGEFQVRTDISGIERHLEHLERIANRIVVGIIIAALILSAALVFFAFRMGH